MGQLADDGELTEVLVERDEDAALARAWPRISSSPGSAGQSPAQITSCPAATRRRRLPTWAIAAGIAAVFLGLAGFARLTGHWHTDVDPQLYYELIPCAADFGHPR